MRYLQKFIYIFTNLNRVDYISTRVLSAGERTVLLNCLNYYNQLIMRKFLFALMALLLTTSVAVRSQNVMVVHLKTGTVAELAFKYKPVITFTDTDAVLTTTINGREIVVSYPLEKLTKFTFVTKDITAVEEVEEDRNVQFLIEDYTVTITGAKPEIVVRLIASDGKQLGSYKTDKDGSVSFSIAELAAGTYIIASEDITFKILKK